MGFGAEVAAVVAAPGVRLARRADRARRLEVHADPVRAGDGAVRRAARLRRARRDPRDRRSEQWPLRSSFPRLGQGMESGTVVKWLKAEGDAVEKGEPLYELDTDKVTQEVEAEAAGVLLKIAVPEGEVPVGTTIAFIGEQGEAVPDVSGNGKVRRRRRGAEGEPPAEPEPEPQRRGAASRAARAVSRAGRASGSRPRRSRAGSPASAASSSRRSPARGPTAGSSPRTSSAPPSAAAARRRAAACRQARSRRVPLTSIRRTIARRLTEAWRSRSSSSRSRRTWSARTRSSPRARELHPDVKVSVTDLLTKICASALVRHPDVNVSFTEEALLRHPSANVGIAVAAPQGLVVPVVKERRAAVAGRDRRRPRRPRRPGARPEADGRGHGRRHVHDLEPGHVRRRVVHRRAQPAAGGDPRRRRDRGPAGRRATERSSSGRR